jgi:hypothetical protein
VPKTYSQNQQNKQTNKPPYAYAAEDKNVFVFIVLVLLASSRKLSNYDDDFFLGCQRENHQMRWQLERYTVHAMPAPWW